MEKIYFIKRASKEYLKANYMVNSRAVAFWITEQGLPPTLYWSMEIPLFLLMVKNTKSRLIFENKDSLYNNEFLFSKVKNQIHVIGIKNV